MGVNLEVTGIQNESRFSCAQNGGSIELTSLQSSIFHGPPHSDRTGGWPRELSAKFIETIKIFSYHYLNSAHIISARDKSDIVGSKQALVSLQAFHLDLRRIVSKSPFFISRQPNRN